MQIIHASVFLKKTLTCIYAIGPQINLGPSQAFFFLLLYSTSFLCCSKYVQEDLKHQCKDHLCQAEKSSTCEKKRSSAKVGSAGFLRHHFDVFFLSRNLGASQGWRRRANCRAAAPTGHGQY